MPNTKISKPLVFSFILGCLIASGPSAFANTLVQSPAQEDTQADNALIIGHGCEILGSAPKAVIAQSVLFPQADLTGVTESGGIGTVDTIQSKDIFNVQGEKQDALGKVFGFYAKKGRLATESQGRVPFSFFSPIFVKSSCVKTLKIELAVADICAASNPKIKEGKVNLWIPDNGSKYAVEGAKQGLDGIGAPPVLIVNRDLDKNPFDPLSSCGEGTTMTVTPTADEIDRNLGIPGYW